MVPHAGIARPTETVEAVRERLQGMSDDAEVLCLTDEQGRFAGLVTYSRLLSSAPGTPVVQLIDGNTPEAGLDDDQEAVAGRALAAGVFAVPVVDGQRRLRGVVPPRALLAVLRHEHEEDMNRFTGIIKNGEQARDAIEGSLRHRVVNRLPWLLVGLGGSMFATWLMTGFEDTLRAQLAAAFFIPAVVYLADAIGTQTEAVAVRGLSFSNASLLRLLTGELLTGAVIGTVISSMIFPAVWFFFGDARLALAVSSAVVIAGLCASSIGLLLPWWLSRLGVDPAYGSGPLATIMQDILSLLTYLGIVALLV